MKAVLLTLLLTTLPKIKDGQHVEAKVGEKMHSRKRCRALRNRDLRAPALEQ
jgi:hypothetical protein